MMTDTNKLAFTYHIYQYQVGGRTLILKSPDNIKILKKILEINELYFYTYIKSLHASHPHYAITTFIPKFLSFLDLDEASQDIKLGQELIAQNTNPKMNRWLEHVREHSRNQVQSHQIFIEMQNFCHQYKKLNLMDIKVGKMPSHEENQWSIKNNLKITGALKTKSNGETQFGSRYEFKDVVDEQKFKEVLAWFFIDENQILKTDKIQKSILQLKDLSLILRSFKGWAFKSASVCFLYDTQDASRNQIKYIDFGKISKNQINHQYDEKSINGLQNLIRFLSQILCNPQQYSKTNINYNENQYIQYVPSKNKKPKQKVSNENQLRAQLTKYKQTK